MRRGGSTPPLHTRRAPHFHPPARPATPASISRLATEGSPPCPCDTAIHRPIGAHRLLPRLELHQDDTSFDALTDEFIAAAWVLQADLTTFRIDEQCLIHYFTMKQYDIPCISYGMVWFHDDEVFKARKCILCNSAWSLTCGTGATRHCTLKYRRGSSQQGTVTYLAKLDKGAGC